MAATPWHLQNSTTLDINVEDGSGSGTDYAIAGVTEATVMLSRSIVELFTGDSVKREDKYQEEVQPELEVTQAKWDPDVINKVLIKDNDATTLSGTALEDRSEVNDISFSGTFNDSGNNNSVTIELSGLTTEEWPIFDLSTGDYGEWSISFVADDIDTYTVN